MRCGFTPGSPGPRRVRRPGAPPLARAAPGWFNTAMTHSLPVRVYYEDTDLAGIVYYANYFRYIERGRTEWVRGLGIDQAQLKARDGTVFAVARVEADYLRPAKFDDQLTVTTALAETGPARVWVAQEVLRGAEILFRARVLLVALGPDGRPRRIPEALRQAG